jgi:hypothetical protein
LNTLLSVEGKVQGSCGGEKCQVLNTLLSVEGKVQGSCGGEKMPSVEHFAKC